MNALRGFCSIMSTAITRRHSVPLKLQGYVQRRRHAASAQIESNFLKSVVKSTQWQADSMGSRLHVQMRGRAPEGGFCSFFILFYFICLFILDRPIQVCKVQHRHQENKQRQWHFNRKKQPRKNNIVDSDILNIRFCASRIRTDTKSGSWHKKVIKKTLKTITCVHLQRQISMTSFLLFFPFCILCWYLAPLNRDKCLSKGRHLCCVHVLSCPRLTSQGPAVSRASVSQLPS